MTEKLYYSDAYIREFDATVLSSNRVTDGFDTILDRTAFFPEEGGQSSDGGKIGEATVLRVSEESGVIHHLTDREVKGDIHCSLDWKSRFDKMQCHTAEHIVCGIIHSLYGYENVGFHLGDDEVTFDISSPLSREELDRIEVLANEAVFSNLKVTAYFPSTDEIPSLEYRSKLDITENLRIVNIGDVDSCACCAPHVAYTGEIGLIKLIDFFKHRGGVRITLVAGSRALADYSAKCVSTKRISAMLSSPESEIADSLTAYMKETDDIRYRLTLARRELTDRIAGGIAPTDKNAVLFADGLSFDEMRDIANSATDRVGDMLVLLSGTDGDYKYVISSKTRDMGTDVREINAALNGKGGGRGRMVQGTLRATAAAIRDYFIK